MTQDEITALFAPMWGGFINLVETEKRPLLAHYTTLESLEKIVRTNELWFSCPLFMNDLQEMRFGMLEGRRIFEEAFSDQTFIAAYGAANKVAAIKAAFHAIFNEFDEKQALDTYVFCLSEHDLNRPDGLLSMWRGYGGNGHGAAIIFTTDFITLREESPLLIAKVNYASEDQRRQWINDTITTCKNILLENEIEDDKLHVFAYLIFELLKIHALLSKHHGFSEENEWRIIYLSERDQSGMLRDKLGYISGKNGVEPKLKFPIKPLPFEKPEAWTFSSIVHTIILGPSLSSTLSVNAVRRMFQTLGKPEFAAKTTASGIPLRPV